MLLGSGGIGKARIAAEVARRQVRGFDDGVVWVELSTISNPGLVAQTIAMAIGVREQPGESILDSVERVLRAQSRLLLLDNCEHLLAECAALAERLLRSCPRLSILSTSRQPIGLGGETMWRVPALAVPDTVTLDQERTDVHIDAIPDVASVALFVDRAQLVLPSFRCTSSNGPAVADICRRLDGIPLAIELAAAWTRVLAPEQIAERLNDALGLLTRSDPAALPHHRTPRRPLLAYHHMGLIGARILVRSRWWSAGDAISLRLDGHGRWGPASCAP
jgi:predicted ATPase